MPGQDLQANPAPGESCMVLIRCRGSQPSRSRLDSAYPCPSAPSSSSPCPFPLGHHHYLAPGFRLMLSPFLRSSFSSSRYTVETTSHRRAAMCPILEFKRLFPLSDGRRRRSGMVGIARTAPTQTPPILQRPEPAPATCASPFWAHAAGRE